MTALLRLIGWALAIALVALPVVALNNGWWGSERWPLTTMRVSGTFARVQPTQLQAALRPFAARGFFAVDLDAAQRAVAALPWVERAEVRKRWPDVLEVVVIEHRPFAQWGDRRLLSDRGRLFPARDATVPDDLPRLSGPDDRVSEVVALYNESKALFASIGVDVRRVELDARGSWTLSLGNGAELVVGRFDARTRLSRFARLMPQLLDRRMQPLKRADLRYTNGFALTWVEETPTTAAVARPGSDAPALGRLPTTSRGNGASALPASSDPLSATSVALPRITSLESPALFRSHRLLIPASLS